MLWQRIPSRWFLTRSAEQNQKSQPDVGRVTQLRGQPAPHRPMEVGTWLNVPSAGAATNRAATVLTAVLHSMMRCRAQQPGATGADDPCQPAMQRVSNRPWDIDVWWRWHPQLRLQLPATLLYAWRTWYHYSLLAGCTRSPDEIGARCRGVSRRWHLFWSASLDVFMPNRS
jgi:hypothetical protein